MSKIYIVGTPIGNLKDITLRAIETLQKVDYIACEDTRVTRNLLKLLEIDNKKLIAYHDKNERQSANGLINLINQGNEIALVSDAGMPTISDPGFAAIKEAINNNINVEIIPGVSAAITTAVLSNFDTFFKFDGFLKPKSGQRQNQLKKWEPGTHIVYVSPHNILRVLEDIEIVFGEDINVFVGRELTKKFETHYRGTVTEVKEKVAENVKGEFTMAIEVKKKKVNKYDKK